MALLLTLMLSLKSSLCWLVVFAIGWLELPVAAAGFSCAKASTAQEKTVCANPQLSKLDDEIVAAYVGVHAQLSQPAAAEVLQDQRAWLVWLGQVCPDRNDPGRKMSDCLKNEYAERLEMLRSGLLRAGGMTIFPRLKVLIMPDKEQPRPESNDPGFGLGRFSWPEIDKPTPAAENMKCSGSAAGGPHASAGRLGAPDANGFRARKRGRLRRRCFLPVRCPQ